MRKLGITLITTALLIGSAVGVGAQEVEPNERSLFVGNSFTTWRSGDVIDHFTNLVAADVDAPTMAVDDSIIWGGTLGEHLPSAPGVIRDGGYSIVVLQGDIPWKKRTVDPFLEAARTLDEVIDESGARTVFYMTWTYPGDDWLGLDGIVDAHRLIGEELGATVAPVGIAMDDALAERPDLALIEDDDDGHQTDHGAYLAAATIYAAIFDRSPEGLPYVPEGITADEVAFFQQIAWRAVQEWQ
jgi:hypothetical protein